MSRYISTTSKTVMVISLPDYHHPRLLRISTRERGLQYPFSRKSETGDSISSWKGPMMKTSEELEKTNLHYTECSKK